jgi:hypothetical protein
VAVVTPEDSRFEQRWHPFQRVGRVLVLLGLLAALLGVFGTGGPLAGASTTGPRGAFSVDYERFVRTTQSTPVEISARPTGGPGTVAIAQDFLDATKLGGVSPQPDSETARGGRVVLRYQGSLPDRVELQLTPEKIGVHRATIWVDGTPVSFRQVTWP